MKPYPLDGATLRCPCGWMSLKIHDPDFAITSHSARCVKCGTVMGVWRSDRDAPGTLGAS